MTVTPSGNSVPLLLAMTGAPFEEALLAVVTKSGSRLLVRRRCLDLADLLAVATAHEGAVAAVWHRLHRFDREAVARLAAAGVRVVAVVGDDEGTDAMAGDVRRLAALGVDRVVAARQRDGEWDGASLAASLDAASADGGAVSMDAVEHGFAAPPGPWGTPTTGPQTHPLGAPAGAGAAGDDASVQSGRLVAVWGPVGAPGRTTVAITLADEAARMGHDVLLVDGDTYGPCIAQRLGVLDESSGAAAAARAATAGELDVARLSACARTLEPRLRVLTGITRPERWPELRPASLSAVWGAARQLAELTVVDVGFCLEDDEELAYDTAAPRRNGAALLTLQRADSVVAVGSGDPVGLQRLVRGLHALRGLDIGADVRVVVTRVRRGPVGRSPARRISDTLHRLAGVRDLVLVPDDVAGLDASLAQGAALADAAPRSPVREPLRRLAERLLAEGAA